MHVQIGSDSTRKTVHCDEVSVAVLQAHPLSTVPMLSRGHIPMLELKLKREQINFST